MGYMPHGVPDPPVIDADESEFADSMEGLDTKYPEGVPDVSESEFADSIEGLDTPVFEDQWNLNLDEVWEQKFLRFVEASRGKIIPMDGMGRVGADVYPDWIRRIGIKDRGLADAMGTLRDTPFTRGFAAILEYTDGGVWAKENSRRYGVHLNPEFPELAEPVGRLRRRPRHAPLNRFNKADIADRLFEIAEGSMHYGHRGTE